MTAGEADGQLEQISAQLNSHGLQLERVERTLEQMSLKLAFIGPQVNYLTQVVESLQRQQAPLMEVLRAIQKRAGS